MNHFELLEKGIDSWNRWRFSNAQATCDLSGQDLRHGYFFEGDFSGVNLSGADLRRACLIGANLTGADLTGADLTGAYLGDANLYRANLSHANLTEANLDRANLQRANLLGTQIAKADIRMARLPDPTVDPYTDVLISSLSQSPSRVQLHQQSVKGTMKKPWKEKIASRKIASRKEHKERKLSTAEIRRSLLQQMQRQLQLFTRESPEVARLRQQAIRQSSAPLPTQRSTYSLQNRSPQNWGRRQQDKQLSALVGRQMSRRRVWIPVAVASLLAAIGLPWSLWNLGSRQVVAQSQSISQRAVPFALAKSLSGDSHVWAVATHQVADRSASWVIGGEANGRIEIWDAQTGKQVRSLSGHSSGVRSLAVSASGRWLVSGGSDGLKVWSLSAGTLAYDIPAASVASDAASDAAGDSVFKSAVWSVAISQDERTFISSDYAGKITAWNLASGEQRYQIDNGVPVWSVAITPDGQSFVGGSEDRIVRQWNLASGELIREFAGHQDAVRTVVLSPDGATLVSGSSDETIKLWNLVSGQLLTTLDANKGGHRDRIVSLAISPDGTTLASGSNDSTVKLWDLPSRQLSETLEDHTSSISAVAFDSQGQTLVSGGEDQTVKVWQ